jgi:hypothetical protein
MRSAALTKPVPRVAHAKGNAAKVTIPERAPVERRRPRDRHRAAAELTTESQEAAEILRPRRRLIGAACPPEPASIGLSPSRKRGGLARCRAAGPAFDDIDVRDPRASRARRGALSRGRTAAIRIIAGRCALIAQILVARVLIIRVLMTHGGRIDRGWIEGLLPVQRLA